MDRIYVNLIFLFFTGVIIFVSPIAYAAERSGWLLSPGYGSLSVNNIIVADNPNPDSAPEAFNDNDWNFLNIGFGYFINSGKTQFLFDILISESKNLESDLGTRPLVGGGVTHLSSSISHVGMFIGLRQKLFSRLFMNAGIGGFSQGKEFNYSPDVSNGTAGGSEEVSAWFWGLDVGLTSRFLFGAKIYNSFGSPSSESSSDTGFEVKGTTFQLTYLLK